MACSRPMSMLKVLNVYYYVTDLSPKRRFYIDFFSLFVWEFSVIWNNEIKATVINMIIIMMMMMMMMSTKTFSIILKLRKPP